MITAIFRWINNNVPAPVQVIVGGVAGVIFGLVILEWIQPGSWQQLCDAIADGKNR